MAVIIGIDPHMRSHTAVAVDGTGRKLGQVTVGAAAADLVRLLDWATQWDGPLGGPLKTAARSQAP